MADAPDNMPEQADGPSADAESRPNQIVVLRDYCTRTHGAACDRCALACPLDAISFAEDGRPVIDADACTRCGICLGICDAFSSSRVTMIDVHARIRRIALRGEDVVLTCKENIFPGLEPAANVVVLPCLACLSPEFWTLVLTENIPAFPPTWPTAPSATAPATWARCCTPTPCRRPRSGAGRAWATST